MVLQFIRAMRILVLAAFVAFSALIVAPAAQAQQGAVRPTEQSLKEADLLKALKSGESVAGRVTIPDRKSGNLIQPEGQEWRVFKTDTLPRVGAIAILGMLVLLGVFYAVRGRIMIDSGRSGQVIERFGAFDRFVHWLTAVSFILLAISGLNITFGRSLVLPVLGAEAFTALSVFGKLVHNYVGFAFMVGVVLTLLIWVKDNIPSGIDVQWLARFGGLWHKGDHPPAKRFNAGQKGIFWSVVIGGALMSISGLHLLFPNSVDGGIAEVQWQSMIHGVVAMVMVAIILAHIYIGSVGMEGAKEAMTSGEVDLNWAKEHHSLWVEDVLKERGNAVVHPTGKVAAAE